ncbi:MAG: TonB-dependent receptor [Acidobacteria bacterium]|nr:MAG: TonB-dependent receptor [Acidobacteriota bacterium]
MRAIRVIVFSALACLVAGPAYATIFGNVRGIVHDPQHRPIPNAEVVLRAGGSAWSQTARSNSDGEFEFSAVPAGEYSLSVNAQGFQPAEQSVTVSSGAAPIFHFALEIAMAKQSVSVSAAPETVNSQAASTQTTLDREHIDRTPGAGRTNSLAMITDYVPGAYMVHDQLHVRGGHQVSWEVDGVPVPNTNIASNVGPQFDPKDADYVEMKTGGYSSEYGDRTYGVFNVIPRTGFEYNNQGELVASYGSFNQTNDQFSFGNHTDRLAWFGSLTGNRSDLGLMTPVPQAIHDMNSGLGGFGTLIFNVTPQDQLRLVASARGDHYQIPNTPEQQNAGIRDLDLERDAFVNFSWVHTFGPGMLLTISPFYHFNRANFVSGPNDIPFILDNNRRSNYLGGQATLGVVKGKHNAQFGLEGFDQGDDTFFGLSSAEVAGQPPIQQRYKPSGNMEAAFFQDQFQLTSWLSLSAGVRLTHYAGLLQENGIDPRVGAAIRVPRLGWVLRGFYGRYLQPPPLDTFSGPLEQFALEQGVAFLPLHAERDEQYQAGVTIPLRDWMLDADIFRTRARNFFDHDEIGSSNIFLPLTIQGARIQGWESTLRSPEVLHHARIHVAWSHQFVQGFGVVTGGLTNFEPPQDGFFFLDHDQRNTLSTVVTGTLPGRAWATTAIAYGSGFLDGNGPAHLPAHTTIGLSLGKSFGEDWSLAVHALNIGDHRYQLDNSNTFGGTHYAYPREVYVEMRYRFHF